MVSEEMLVQNILSPRLCALLESLKGVKSVRALTLGRYTHRSQDTAAVASGNGRRGIIGKDVLIFYFILFHHMFIYVRI